MFLETNGRRLKFRTPFIKVFNKPRVGDSSPRQRHPLERRGGRGGGGGKEREGEREREREMGKYGELDSEYLKEFITSFTF